MSTVTVTVDRKQAEKLTTYYGDADCDCAPCQIAREMRSALDVSDQTVIDSEELARRFRRQVGLALSILNRATADLLTDKEAGNGE